MLLYQCTERRFPRKVIARRPLAAFLLLRHQEASAAYLVVYVAGIRTNKRHVVAQNQTGKSLSHAPHFTPISNRGEVARSVLVM